MKFSSVNGRGDDAIVSVIKRAFESACS